MECAALEAKGVSAGPKHFFANDQETWRTGVATYGNEQAFRENQLRAFEGAFVGGGATSVMTCFNRVGPVWVGQFANVQKNIMRGEWGFDGIFITDASGSNSYMHTVQSLVNGTNLHCLMTGTAKDNRKADLNTAINSNDDGYLVNVLKENAHRVYYTYAHTNIMNGLASAYQIVPVTPVWQTAVTVAVGALWVITIALAVAYAVVSSGKKKEEN